MRATVAVSLLSAVLVTTIDALTPAPSTTTTPTSVSSSSLSLSPSSTASAPATSAHPVYDLFSTKCAKLKEPSRMCADVDYETLGRDPKIADTLVKHRLDKLGREGVDERGGVECFLALQKLVCAIEYPACGRPMCISLRSQAIAACFPGADPNLPIHKPNLTATKVASKAAHLANAEAVYIIDDELGLSGVSINSAPNCYGGSVKKPAANPHAVLDFTVDKPSNQSATYIYHGPAKTVTTSTVAKHPQSAAISATAPATQPTSPSTSASASASKSISSSASNATPSTLPSEAATEQADFPYITVFFFGMLFVAGVTLLFSYCEARGRMNPHRFRDYSSTHEADIAATTTNQPRPVTTRRGYAQLDNEDDIDDLEIDMELDGTGHEKPTRSSRYDETRDSLDEDFFDDDSDNEKQT